VPGGLYQEVRTGRVVQLDTRDILPASLDGRVACYIRLDDSDKDDPAAENVAGASDPRAGAAG
jgi:hypothetical protein